MSSAGVTADADAPASPHYQDVGRDKFEAFEENRVKLVSEEPVSTFSADVDTASYSFVRRLLNNGVLPQGDAVRAEEMINYFDYDYPLPISREEPFQPTVAVTDAPWADGRKLMHIGVKGYDIAPQLQPRSNLVFLLDVSGSMGSNQKLENLQTAAKDFVTQVINANGADRVSISIVPYNQQVYMDDALFSRLSMTNDIVDINQTGTPHAGEVTTYQTMNQPARCARLRHTHQCRCPQHPRQKEQKERGCIVGKPLSIPKCH